jgi:hypothetical protein
MDVGSTSLPAYKTPKKLEGKFKSDELFMLVVAHISLFTSFRSQTKSGGTLAILKKTTSNSPWHTHCELYSSQFWSMVG